MLRVSLSDKAVYKLESDILIRIKSGLDLGKPCPCNPKYYRKYKKDVHVSAGEWIDGENHENANILYACLKGLFWAIDNKEYSYNSAVIDISYFVDEPDMLSIAAKTLCEELDDLSSSIKGLESREFCIILSTFNERLDEKIRQLEYELKDASIATVPQAFGDLDDPITWDAVDIVENKRESFVEILNELLYRYFGSDWKKKKREITHFLKEECGMVAGEISKIISTSKRQKPRKDYVANVYFAIFQNLPEKHLKEWLDYDLALKFFCAAGHNLEIEEFNAYCECYQKTKCFGEYLDDLLNTKCIDLRLYRPLIKKVIPKCTDRYVTRKIVTDHMIALLHTTDNFSLGDCKQLFDAAGYEFNESEFPQIDFTTHVGKQLMTYLRKLNKEVDSEDLSKWIKSKYLKDLCKQKVIAKEKVNRLGAQLKNMLRDDVFYREQDAFAPVQMLFNATGYSITREEFATLDTKNYFGMYLEQLLENLDIEGRDKVLLSKYSITSSDTFYNIRHDIIHPLKTRIHCIILGINYVLRNDSSKRLCCFDITDAEKLYQKAGYQLSNQESDATLSQWELRDDALVRHCFEKGYNMIDVDHFLQNIWGYESGWGEKENPNKGRRYDNEGIVEVSKQALVEREI